MSSEVESMAIQSAPAFPTDDYIRQQPVSKEREQRLLANYLAERRLTRTTEMLFDRVGALRKESVPAPAPVGDFGFKVLVSKRSFVEGVASHIVSAREWAVGQEDFLLQYFEEKLRAAGVGRLGIDVERDVRSVLDALDQMTTELRARGFTPSGYVIAAQIGQELYRELLQELKRATQDPWDWYTQPGPHIRATHRFVGAFDNVPVVAIDATSLPAVYALDVVRFATLTRYGVGPDFDPEFRVEAFTDEAARNVLARQPNLILDPPPESGLEDERIRQLQLRVGLELWETYKLDVKDPGAVIARPLADPVYE
jgi:hypothetical protein